MDRDAAVVSPFAPSCVCVCVCVCVSVYVCVWRRRKLTAHLQLEPSVSSASSAKDPQPRPSSNRSTGDQWQGTQRGAEHARCFPKAITAIRLLVPVTGLTPTREVPPSTHEQRARAGERADLALPLAPSIAPLSHRPGTLTN